MFLGAHMSVSGGLHLAIHRIMAVSGTALQIFTRNQRQWKSPMITEDEGKLFHDAWQRWGDYPICAHTSYLINLAAKKTPVMEKSVQALVDELIRCHKLKIPHVVLHPGSHGGQGTDTAILLIAANIDHAFEQAPQATLPIILLETTAGQGTGVGATFEEIAAIISTSRHAHRLGVCLDTCHIFAAGYDIRTPDTYYQTMKTFDRIIGLAALKCIHINDSKKGLGARVDRHEHIGKGEIDHTGFSCLMQDPRISMVPKILETPKKTDLEDDRINLAILKGMVKKACSSPPATGHKYDQTG